MEWDPAEWERIQLPKLNRKSGSFVQHKEEWLRWIESLKEVRSSLWKTLKKREQKWRDFYIKLQQRQQEEDFDHGFTKRLIRQVFPEKQPGEPASIEEGTDWIVDPKAVANKAGEAAHQQGQPASFAEVLPAWRARATAMRRCHSLLSAHRAIEIAANSAFPGGNIQSSFELTAAVLEPQR